MSLKERLQRVITPRSHPENAHKRNVRTTPREKSINQRFQLTLYGKSSFDKFFFSPIYFTTSDSDSEVPAFN